MTINYRGWTINDYQDQPWTATEISFHKRLIDTHITAQEYINSLTAQVDLNTEAIALIDPETYTLQFVTSKGNVTNLPINCKELIVGYGNTGYGIIRPYLSGTDRLILTTNNFDIGTGVFSGTGWDFNNTGNTFFYYNGDVRGVIYDSGTSFLGPERSPSDPTKAALNLTKDSASTIHGSASLEVEGVVVPGVFASNTAEGSNGTASKLPKYLVNMEMMAFIRPYLNGFVDIQDPEYRGTIQVSWDIATKAFTISSTTGFVNFWSDGGYNSIPNGDGRLVASLPLVGADPIPQSDDYIICSNKFGTFEAYRYSDSDLDEIRMNCTIICTYDHDLENIIAALLRTKGVGSDSSTYCTQKKAYGQKWVSGCDIFGAVAGGMTTGYTPGKISDIDYIYETFGYPSTGATYHIYYLEGLNYSNNNRIKTDPTQANSNLAMIDPATGRAYYNPETVGFGLAVVDAGKFTTVSTYALRSADGSISITSNLGHKQYANITEARGNVEADVQAKKQAITAVNNICLLHTFIINSSGQIQVVDADTGSLAINHR